MDTLPSRLLAHIAQMAPHQKAREAGRLLCEALARIEALEATVNNSLVSQAPRADSPTTMPTDFKPPTAESFLTPEMREQFDRTLAEAMRKYQVACNELTEQQVMEVLKQALACGDIQKLVVAGSNQQSVVYIPFRRVDELESEIARLNKAIADIDSSLNALRTWQEPD